MNKTLPLLFDKLPCGNLAFPQRQINVLLDRKVEPVEIIVQIIFFFSFDWPYLMQIIAKEHLVQACAVEKSCFALFATPSVFMFLRKMAVSLFYIKLHKNTSILIA